MAQKMARFLRLPELLDAHGPVAVHDVARAIRVDEHVEVALRAVVVAGQHGPRELHGRGA